jgi:hypothetical protein
MPGTLLGTSCLAAALVALAPEEIPGGGAEESAGALERFRAAAEDTRWAVVHDITRRVEASGEPGLRELLRLRDHALAELPFAPYRPPRFHDPAEFAAEESAKGRVHREFLDPDSEEARRQRDQYRPGDNIPPLYFEVRYEFGPHSAVELPVSLEPERILLNYLSGEIPRADVLLAWLEWKFDHDRRYSEVAEHFAHAYCDLAGRCNEDVTLYDAIASEEHMDMPDVDVIAFARRIEDDDSYRSPIPAGSRRERLYQRVEDAFLPYFRYRSFVEEAAYLYLNPEAWLRPEHEGLRQNVLFLVAHLEGDVDRLRAEFADAGDRAGFMDRSLELVKENSRSWRQKIERLTRERTETRWAVAAEAYAVLEEYGLRSPDGPAGGER